MTDATHTLSTSTIEDRVRRAVQAKGGSVSLGDVVVETGIPHFEAERALKSLLKTYEGHLRVSEQGDLLYSFDPKLIRRDHRSLWARSKEKAYWLFKKLFKIWIMVTLVVYFVLYLAILLALIFGNRNSNSRININPFFIYWLFWGRSSHYDSSFDNRGGKPRIPFSTRIHQFVFGPEEEKSDPLALQKRATQMIKAKRGVVSVEDWVMVTGHSMEQAESEMARYTAIFDGEAVISEDGHLTYTFANMLRTEQRQLRSASPPSPTWQRLEEKKPLTGNTTGSNVGIFMLNIFNFTMASFFATAFFFATPETLMEYGEEVQSTLFTEMFLGYFPLVFSFLFFLIPFIRIFSTKAENNRRRQRNMHRVTLRNAFTSTAIQRPSLQIDKVKLSIDDALKQRQMAASTTTEANAAMRKTLIDLEGDITTTDDGEIFYTFETLRENLKETDMQRERMALDKQAMGDIVFDTREDYTSSGVEAKQEEKELDDFTRRLEEGMPSKSSRL